MMQPAISLEQAHAIIDTVIDAGIFEPPKPTEEVLLIRAAADVIKQAEGAKRAGVTVPAVLKVIDLASALDNPADIYNTKVTEPATATLEEFVAADPKGTAKGCHCAFDVDWEHNSNCPNYKPDNDSREDTAAVSTDATPLERDQEQESSHYLDPDSAIDIPALPRDFSKVGDLELRSLHAVRHAVLSKCIFELGLETADYESAQVNYDQEYKRCQMGIDGKVTDKRDQAYLTPTVTDWRTKIGQHHRKVIMLRAYKELLESEIKGLSREFTMRTGERTATP